MKKDTNGKSTSVLMSLAAGLSMAGLVAGLAADAGAATFYAETFTGNTADDPLTSINNLATISGEAGHVDTDIGSGQEGQIVAGPGLGISASSYYVVSWDVTINSFSEGQNFYVVPVAVNSGIHDIYAWPIDDGTGDWEFRVEHGGADVDSDNDYSFGTTLSFTMIHTANVSNEIELYVDDILFGTFTDSSPLKDLDRIIFGDNSGNNLTNGDATYDNIFIRDTLVVVPEPATIGLLGVGGLLVMWGRGRAGRGRKVAHS